MENPTPRPKSSRPESALDKWNEVVINKELEIKLEWIKTNQELKDKLKSKEINKKALRAAITKPNWIVDFSEIQKLWKGNVNFERVIRLSDIIEKNTEDKWYFYRKWKIFQISKIDDTWRTFGHRVDKKWSTVRPKSIRQLFVNSLDVLIKDKENLWKLDTKKTIAETRTLSSLNKAKMELKKKVEKIKDHPQIQIKEFLSLEDGWIKKINSNENFSADAGRRGLLSAVEKLITWRNITEDSKEAIRDAWVDKYSVRYFQAVLRNYFVTQIMEEYHQSWKTIDNIPNWTRVRIVNWKLEIFTKKDVELRNKRNEQAEKITTLVKERNNMKDGHDKFKLNLKIDIQLSKYANSIAKWVGHLDNKDFAYAKNLINIYPDTGSKLEAKLNIEWRWVQKNKDLWINLWLIEKS